MTFGRGQMPPPDLAASPPYLAVPPPVFAPPPDQAPTIIYVNGGLPSQGCGCTLGRAPVNSAPALALIAAVALTLLRRRRR
jgi:MYXO-CTERM domain-containing protein